MSNSTATRQHRWTAMLVATVVRSTKIACALVAAAMTLSCTPVMPSMLSRHDAGQRVVTGVESALAVQRAIVRAEGGTSTDAGWVVSLDERQLDVADGQLAGDASAAVVTESAPASPQEAYVQPAVSQDTSYAVSASEQRAAQEQVTLGDDDAGGQPRFDWTSVDTYHDNPPLYNALGRFEERWYAAHNFTEIGAGITSLAEGDLLRVDGVLLQVSWIYDGSYESTYNEVRSIVGEESYCLQTCTGVGTGIRVAVCYPA